MRKVFFKHPPTSMPSVSMLTWEERGMLSEILEVTQEIEIYQLTTEWLAKILKIHRPKAEKILPKFQEILDEFYQILPENSEKLDEISEKLPKNIASNPHGSTRVKRERIERENRESKEKRKTLISDDWQPSEKFHKWLRENRPEITSAELDYQISKMIANHQANGRKYSDHEAALRNWFQSDFYKPMPKAVTSGWRLPG